MVNDEDLHAMSPYERQVLRDLKAISLWTLLSFLGIAAAPVLLAVLSMLGF